MKIIYKKTIKDKTIKDKMIDLLKKADKEISRDYHTREIKYIELTQKEAHEFFDGMTMIIPGKVIPFYIFQGHEIIISK